MGNILFYLHDGTPVFKGDALWHPDRNTVGWCCFAQSKPNGEYVVVKSSNGAVPTVRVVELRKQPPEPIRCSKCGQLLPESKSTY